MGYLSNLDIERRNDPTGFNKPKVPDLEEFAAALGGEVSGDGWIRAPSPGNKAVDRSLVVKVYPNKEYFIYACEGRRAAAHVLVRKALDLFPRASATDSPNLTGVALRIWGEALPIEGTCAEAYLRRRGITLPLPPSLRFHRALKQSPTGGSWPAMVALVTRDGSPVAIHRTYLYGPKKAPVAPEKMTLGPCGGGAVDLGGSSGPLMVGEGIETSLSALQETGNLTWAALSAPGLASVRLPPAAKRIVLLLDNDAAGIRAGERAARRLHSEGRDVRLAYPPDGFNDFNDALLGKGGLSCMGL